MPAPSPESIAYPEVQAGVQVYHPTFGVGKVVVRTGSDENSKALVKFKEEGEKKLALKHAHLTVDKVEEEPAAVAPAADAKA